MYEFTNMHKYNLHVKNKLGKVKVYVHMEAKVGYDVQVL